MKWQMTWNTMWYVWLSSMAVAITGGGMAWWQWYQYHKLVQELMSLRAAYQTLSEMMLYPCSRVEDQEDSSFIFINRDTAYLTKEARAFIQQSFPDRMRSFMRQERNAKTPRRNHRRSRNTSNVWLSLPLRRGQFWVSSLFGPRKQPSGKPGYHYGVDFAASRGTPVYASADGKVMYAGWWGGYGNVVVIRHADGVATRYAHLHAIYVQSGRHVSRGSKIAAVGDTGHVRRHGRDASHLHFEVEHNGKRKNPFYFLHVE